MPEFVDREVERMRASTSSEEVTLLVGFDGDRDELRDDLHELGGEVHEYLGKTTVATSLPESEVDSVCDIEGVLSVEKNKNDVRTLNEGNLNRQSGSKT